jgi:RNA polymerase sigma-70 factor (ECF subfamily)
VVLAAGTGETTESNRALAKLCDAYWPALYAYVRRRIQQVDEAEDLTQAFFERLLEKNYLAEANPQRGRFRAFLLTAFKHFLSKEWAKAKAQKRGGGRKPLSLDFARYDASWAEPADEQTAERHYQRQWAITLLNRVMGRLQREMERQGKGQHFQAFKQFIGGSGESSYSAAAGELGMSEAAARMAASRLRSRYRELLRDEIAQTVSSEEDIDAEVQHLFVALSD